RPDLGLSPPDASGSASATLRLSALRSFRPAFREAPSPRDESTSFERKHEARGTSDLLDRRDRRGRRKVAYPREERSKSPKHGLEVPPNPETDARKRRAGGNHDSPRCTRPAPRASFFPRVDGRIPHSDEGAPAGDR